MKLKFLVKMKLFNWNSLTKNKQLEKRFIMAICLLAMMRVFIFGSAFPFFSNVDEPYHYDVVVKYSKGYFLKSNKIEHFDPAAAKTIALYGTLEYLHDIEKEGPFPPPLWKVSNDTEAVKYLDKNVNYFLGLQEIEINSPPVYYFLTGLWYKAGGLLGLDEGILLYWVRFLDVIVYGLLVLLAYLFCKKLFPGQITLIFGVPILLIAFPQDLFYSINSDVFSPILCLLSVYFLFRIYSSDKSILYYALTGIAISAALLTKLTNVPLLLILLIFLILITKKYYSIGKLKRHYIHLLVLLTVSVLPFVLWLGWNYYILGDFTGTADKITSLHWQNKSFWDWFDHPMFSFEGLWYFLSETLKTFWRGEFVWGLQRIASDEADWFYVISSFVFIIISLMVLISKIKKNLLQNYLPNLINFIMILLFVGIFVVLSIKYDFVNCWYPSREYPFFTSGRLISGIMVPFLIVYVNGLEILLTKLKIKTSPLTIICIISALIIISEVAISTMVFKSSFNLFHML